MNQKTSSVPPDPADLAEKELSNGAVITRLLRLTWRYRVRCVQVLIYQLVLLTMGLWGLSLTGVGIDYVSYVTGVSQKVPRWPFGWHPPADWQPIAIIGLAAAGVALLATFRALMNFLYTTAVAQLVQGEVVMNLRADVYRKLQKLSFRFFDANNSGSIINRVTGDVQSLRMFIDGAVIQSFIMALSLTVYLVYMLRIDVLLTIVCLATTPFLWIMAARFSAIIKPQYKASRKLMDDLVLNFSERIQGINTIKGFALEEESIRSFAAANDNVLNQRQTLFWKSSTFGPLMAFLPQINLALLLGYGGWLAAHGKLNIGTGLVVFAGLLQQFSGQVQNISQIVDSIQQSLIGARRVFEILDSPIEVDSPPNAAPLDTVRGEITFENVSFHYHENNTVLEGISFNVKPGEVVAIAGATGSGKSALMSLIPRFYDPIEGRILLDGRDLKTIGLEDLRRSIGLVFQDNFLFSNTIAMNIAYGAVNATQEQIEKAARIAQAHDFIMEMPKGYQTMLGESGTNLSGGQRQRLSIARAILLEPAILLLDDPTAAIDPETEHEILGAIERAIEGRTTFIVAHRMSTLRRADRIIVLENGRVAQMGTHEELLEMKGLYKQAVSIQQVDPESLRLLLQVRQAEEAKLLKAL
jgi:ATP-binding cassette subfamily B protein